MKKFYFATVFNCFAVIDARHTFQHATTSVQYRDFEGSVCVRETATLNNVTSAEEKRHIIGDTFATVSEREGVSEMMA